MDASNKRVLFLGKTGAGKSSLANTIFGETLFKVDHTFKSGTNKCRAETRSVKGRSTTLIDTPGFFDTHMPEEDLRSEIVRCITECTPGIHAVLIVLRVEKFTEHEQAVINKINKYFSEEVFKYAMVVFTHGDQLPKGQKIQEIVQKNKSLHDLVKKCGDRYHVIDNKYWNKTGLFKKKKYRSNKFQVKEILQTLDKMGSEYKGEHYTNNMLQEVEKEIQREEVKIRESSTNMSEEEIREKAKENVSEELLIRLAGTATGAVLGGLFGAITMAKVFSSYMPAASGPLVTVAIGVAGVVGATVGGAIGYCASKGADTAQGAAKKTFEAVVDLGKTITGKTTDALNELSQKQIK